MTLQLNDKKAIVEEMKGVLSTSVSAAAADYRGLTVSEMDALRSNARTAGVTVRVYRNTLARRAVKETSFECLTEALSGPIVLLFSQEDPGSSARILRDFIKTNEKLEVKALVIDGALHGAEQLEAIASLPTYDEALAQLMSVMKAPVTKYVRTMNETVTQVVRVLSAVAEKKKAA